MSGVQVGVKVVGSVAEEAGSGVATDLVTRAAEIHGALGGGQRVTVAISRSVIDGVTHTVVTVNDARAYRLLQQKAVSLAEQEILGDAPKVLRTWLRRYWNNQNLH